MKMKSAVDWVIRFAIGGSVTLIIGSSIFIPREEQWIFLCLGVPMVIFMGWIYYGTYYELRDHYLYCRSGPFFEKIKYENIKSAREVTNFLSSMALSTKRIEICQHDKGYITGTTFISPLNRELFLQELIKRCHHLEV